MIRLVLVITIFLTSFIQSIPGPTPAAELRQNPQAANGRDTKEHISDLLSSAVMSDRAWGAYLAAENSYGDFVAPLIKMLRPSLDESDTQKLAQRAILDALIRLNATIPDDLVSRLFDQHPVEAIIFSAKEPGQHQTTLLKQMQHEMDAIHWRPIAGMLVDLKTPGFASYLLHGLSLKSTIILIDPSDIGDVPPPPPPLPSPGNIEIPPGYPPIAIYSLCPGPIASRLATNPGKHPITYFRSVYKDSRYQVRDCLIGKYYDGTDDRIELLADLIGNRDAASDIISQRFHWVKYTGSTLFENEVARIRKRLSESWNTFLDALVSHELITKDERRNIDRDPLIQIRDLRKDKTDKLPAFLNLRNVAPERQAAK